MRRPPGGFPGRGPNPTPGRLLQVSQGVRPSRRAGLSIYWLVLMKPLWPRIRPLLAFGRFLGGTSGKRVEAPPAASGAAPAPQPLPPRSGTGQLGQRPQSLTFSHGRSGGALPSSEGAGIRPAWPERHDRPAWPERHYWLSPVSIERVGAAPGGVPGPSDGRAARGDACTLRRDTPHVRTCFRPPAGRRRSHRAERLHSFTAPHHGVPPLVVPGGRAGP
jgi:hypothetical protein